MCCRDGKPWPEDPCPGSPGGIFSAFSGGARSFRNRCEICVSLPSGTAPARWGAWLVELLGGIRVYILLSMVTRVKEPPAECPGDVALPGSAPAPHTSRSVRTAGPASCAQHPGKHLSLPARETRNLATRLEQ